ncbi:uncharacterized protein LOC144452617 [Glandiceps talaboti]
MMNASLLGLLVCVLFGAITINAADPFEFTWNKCSGSGSDDDVSFKNLTLSPMPLSLPGIANMTYVVDVRQLTSETNVFVELVRVVDLGWLGKWRVGILCIAGYGSCNYKLCNPVDFVKDLLCPEDNCQCPPVDGRHKDDSSLNINDIPSALSFVTDGNYEAKITIKHADGKLAGCVKVTFSLGG